MCEETFFFFFALLFKRSAEPLQIFVVRWGCVQKLWYGKLLPLLTHWVPGACFESYSAASDWRRLEFHNWLRKCENRNPVSIIRRTQTWRLFCERETAAVACTDPSALRRGLLEIQFGPCLPSPFFPPLLPFVQLDVGRVSLPGWFPFGTQETLLCCSEHVVKEEHLKVHRMSSFSG